MLGGNLNNAFTQQGANSLGLNARLRGFKNVQACRQWHGCFGWTSHDPGGLNDQICNFAVCDASGNPPTGVSLADCTGTGTWTPTYQTATYETQQTTPDQTKYLTASTAINYQTTDTTESTEVTITAAASGSVTVNPQSGMLTSTLLTTETDVASGSPSGFIPKNISGGYDSVSGTYGNSTVIDSVVGADAHGVNIGLPGQTLDSFINAFNAAMAAGEYGTPTSATPFPQITNQNSYGPATATAIYYWGMLAGSPVTHTVTATVLRFAIYDIRAANPTVRQSYIVNRKLRESICAECVWNADWTCQHIACQVCPGKQRKQGNQPLLKLLTERWFTCPAGKF